MIIYFLLTGSVSFLAGMLLMAYLHKKVDKEANNYIDELKRQNSIYKNRLEKYGCSWINCSWKNINISKN